MAIGFHGCHSERKSCFKYQLVIEFNLCTCISNKFVVTFSRSGTYQYCCCMLDCR